MPDPAWLVTGASSGIGRALAEVLLERGHRVAATVRRPEVLADLVTEHGDGLWLGVVDVTDTTRLREVVATAFAALGRIDVVVSNVGYGLFGAVEEATDEQVEHQIATNLTGSMQLFRAAVPHLRTQGGGRFVQVSSMGAHFAFPGLGVYHATKWGIEGFLEAAAAEVAPFGIDVTIVEPGSTRTAFAGSGAVSAPPLSAYDDTPIAALRDVVATGAELAVGDPRRMAEAIVDVATGPTRCTGVAERVVLGSDAFALVRRALQARLVQVDAQRDHAPLTDAPDPKGPT